MRRVLSSLGLAPVGWLILGWLAFWPTVLWAQAAKPDETASTDKSGGVWSLAYAFVLLCVLLGLMVVLRPTFRRDRAKPEKYDEDE